MVSITGLTIKHVNIKDSTIELTLSHPLGINTPVLVLKYKTQEERQEIMNSLPKECRIRTKTIKTGKGSFMVSNHTAGGTEQYTVNTGKKK